MKIDVLDGFVELVDHMGSDDSIADAARNSYGSGTKKVRSDSGLLDYLMRHEHYSPFSFCQVVFSMKAPLFIVTQALRHDRFHWNLTSARYSVMDTEFFSPETLRKQDKRNKQGSHGRVANERLLLDSIKKSYEYSEQTYKMLLRNDVAREQARTVMPYGQYTQGVVTANLGDWLLFLKKRLDPHAQYEIRVYAQAIFKLLKRLYPQTMDLFVEHELHARTFSMGEVSILRSLVNKQSLELMLKNESPDGKISNKGKELIEKLFSCPRID